MAAVQGRGGAAQLVAGLLLICLLLPAAAKTTYVVGDGAGWSKNLEATWLAGKTFYAGDVLVFRYDQTRHDVTVVGAMWYRRCEVPTHGRRRRRSRVLSSGNDAVTLRRGKNYFICGKPGHCANGMKLAVRAW